MNERSRRHQHARRSNNHQNSHHHQPAGSSSGSSYQQQHINHHQHHSRSIAYHHGHPADTYSANNYRHPSTTTTATDPSSIAPSQTSGECAISICYSYLIAIFSSFLVVLGIYLSVTRFNSRFLYISLVGLSIEAVGACVYCISNIRASKLARRKQRINSDEFVLNGGNNIDNNLLASNLNGNQTQHPQRHHQQNQQPQQQVTTVTHILSNRDLTSSNTADDENTRTNINENSSSAIINNNNNDNNDNTQAPQSDQQTERHEQEQEGEQTTNADQASSPIPPNLESRDGNSTIVIPSPSCRLLIDDQANVGGLQQQQTDQQAGGSNQGSQPSCSTGIQANIIGEVVQRADATIACASPVTDTSSNQLPNQDCQQSPTTTSGDFSSSTILLDDDQQQNQLPLEHSPKHRQRPAHLRRTMVIGLGGEEEMIEIDEQELDNMSILPPSYESITMNDPFKDK